MCAPARAWHPLGAESSVHLIGESKSSTLVNLLLPALNPDAYDPIRDAQDQLFEAKGEFAVGAARPPFGKRLWNTSGP